jgi:hypothetical protein
LYIGEFSKELATFSSDNPWRSVDTAQRALIEYFAEVEPQSGLINGGLSSWWRIKRALPVRVPSVTIIIPTRDKVETRAQMRGRHLE